MCFSANRRWGSQMPRRDLDVLAHLHALSTSLWQTRSLPEGLANVLAAVIHMLCADKGNIQLLDAGRQVLVICVQQGFDSQFLEYFREVSADDGSVCGRALRTGERLIVEDVELDTEFGPHRKIARSTGFRCVQSTPLLEPDGKPIGMLSTHFVQPRRFSAEALRWLDLYARQASDFIQRIRFDEVLRESEERFRRFMAHLPGLAWIKDAKGRYVFANDAA